MHAIEKEEENFKSLQAIEAAVRPGEKIGEDLAMAAGFHDACAMRSALASVRSAQYAHVAALRELVNSVPLPPEIAKHFIEPEPRLTSKPE